MTTREQYTNDRDFVVHSTAYVFGIVRTLVRVFLWIATTIFIISAVYAFGEALWTDPVDFLSFWGPVVGVFSLLFWWRLSYVRKRRPIVEAAHAARKAALYAANEARRAEEFPEIVFAENEEKWRKELAA